MIPFLDLQRLHQSIRSELDAAFNGSMETSTFIGGASVRDFEAEFAAAHGRTGGAGCASGTDALTLALRALDIGRGDEVVVPSMTFVATAEAVIHVGATPVIADVDAESLLLTPETVEQVRTDATRAVIPVHLYGHVVPTTHLRLWRASGLTVLEDAAQAHLATSGGESVGSGGHAACFSFFPGKNLGALGDGGMVVSDDDALLKRVRQMRNHGRTDKYVHDEIGWCSRLDALQAEFLRAKLRHLGRWTSGRQRFARRYRELLEGTDAVRLVPWNEGAVHHLLVIRVDPSRRDSLQTHLDKAGIGTGIHYPIPLSLQPALRPWRRATPVAERVAGEVLSLPIDPLMTDHDVEAIVSSVLSWPEGPG